jgi:Xaa-Pro aminopeptidase
MSRLTKLREKMSFESLEAFIIASPENRRYMSGFTGTSAMLVVLHDKAYLLTDFRYIEQAKAQAPEFEIVDSGTDFFNTIKDLAQGVQRIGFEEDYITYDMYLKLREAVSKGELLANTKLLTGLRSVKDSEELEKIRQAVRIADEAYDHILKFVKPGMTEETVSLELEYTMRKAGASGGSFDFIVASGWRSAMPHGVASSKTLEQGELVTLDFGAVYQGYCSDITRTFVLGKADEKQREIYDIVLKAQLAGISAVKPGLKGKEVDAVSRKIIEDAGYGNYFGHGLGHAVGLAIHEGPRLSLREEQILEPGMVLTVEPGIYLPDWGGVRIEDIVVVTENGCKVLTQAPKQFIIIE